MKVRTYRYPGREEWLADRANFVGASEVASCIGAPGAYSSAWETWARKTGHLPGVEESESMRWGARLERSIAFGVQGDHGGVVEYPDGYVAYGPEDAPHRRATPDAIWHRDGLAWLLEIKNVDRMLAEHWEAGPPAHVVVQLQYQMACTGLNRAAVAALVGGNRLSVFDVDRDDELIVWLCAAVDRFWESVEKREEPTAGARDVDLLPLRWKERRGDEAEVSAGVVASLLDAQEREKAAKHDKDGLRALLMQELGEATEGQVGGETVVTWRENKAGSRVFRIHRDAESVIHPNRQAV